MDNDSEEDNNYWSTLIRQIMENWGGEVRIGDKVFLEEVKNLAGERIKRKLPDNFEATVRKTIYWYAEGHSQKHQSDKKYFLKVDSGVYRLLDVSDSFSSKKINEENSEGQRIYKNKKLTENERLVLIKARIGQGWFRDKLYKKWDGCSVTGYRQREFLIASHIKPWRDSFENPKEQVDIENGFLLIANLDKAFDRGFITFDNNGKIEISPKLNGGKEIGITSNLKLREISEANKVYLKYHRDKVFQKSKHDSV